MFGWLGLGGGIPGLNFTLGDEVGRFSCLGSVNWTMRNATPTESQNEEATVFVVSLAELSDTDQAVARNAMKRAKTIRLPGALKTFEAVEHKNTLYIATERCQPLQSAISPAGRQTYYEGDDDKYLEGVALGLHTVASALSALHGNGIAHHGVSSNSIVVLPSGEWRLFGFELTGAFDEEHSLYRRCRSGLLEHRVPPGRGLDAVHSVDAWGLACLIFEAFTLKEDFSTITHGDLKAPTCVPRKLHPTMNGLLSAEPRSRWPAQKFLTDCTLLKDSTYVADLQFLSELSLRDPVDRDAFLRKVSGRVADYPVLACKLLILPKLNHAVQYGACTATALEPLLKIGARISSDDFAQHVSPSVVTMFASPEHLVRHRLLSTAQEYAPLLPAALVRDKIWPHYATGFTHKSAEIRELSVRALVFFAPHLGEKLMGADVLRYISQLQADPEGAIRTNSTICLSMVGKYFAEADRARILMNGFGRMLKDPFTPVRSAAVKSFASNVDIFSEETTAKQLLPALCPMMLDVDAEVRKAVIKTVQQMTKRVETFAAAIPTAAAAAGSVSTPTGSSAAEQQQPSGASVATPTAASASGPSSKSWFSWGATTSPAATAAPAPTAGGKSAAAEPPSISIAETDRPSSSAASAAVPSAPTAARSAKAMHEDPVTTAASGAAASGGDAGGWDDDDDDDFKDARPTLAPASSSSPPAALVKTPSASTVGRTAVARPVASATATGAATASSGGGMSLRKKTGFAGAVKKAE